MLRAIAIETSGRAGSIAAVADGAVLQEIDFPHGLKHAAEIVPIIDRLCAAQQWRPADLAELYVSAGPGSFTGLRIAITVAKTLAFATGVKIVAVPSVRVLAENAPADARHVLIVLDAKREQIFTARFERLPGSAGVLTRNTNAAGDSRAPGGPAGEEWIEREPAHLEALSAALARAPRPVHLLGEGIPYHEQFIPADPQVIVTPPDLWRARAAAVAKIGYPLARAGQFADPYRLTPIYIRPPEAEEKWDQQRR